MGEGGGEEERGTGCSLTKTRTQLLGGWEQVRRRRKENCLGSLPVAISMGECKKTSAPKAQRKHLRVIVSVKKIPKSDFKPVKEKSIPNHFLRQADQF
jgi:hypothetical protein